MGTMVVKVHIHGNWESDIDPQRGRHRHPKYDMNDIGRYAMRNQGQNSVDFHRRFAAREMKRNPQKAAWTKSYRF